MGPKEILYRLCIREGDTENLLDSVLTVIRRSEPKLRYGMFGSRSLPRLQSGRLLDGIYFNFQLKPVYQKARVTIDSVTFSSCRQVPVIVKRSLNNTGGRRPPLRLTSLTETGGPVHPALSENIVHE